MSRLLPPVVRDDSCCIDSHELRHTTEADGRKLYTYSVTWHNLEQMKSAEGTDVELSAPSPQFSFIKAPKKKDMSPEEMQICKRLAPSNDIRSRVEDCRCDGPCGKIKPVSEMVIMGRCDHYICSDCFKNAPAVEIAGCFGCPNPCCYQTDLACLCKDRRRRHHKFQKIIRMSPQQGGSLLPTSQGRYGGVPHMLKSMPCLHLVDVRLTVFTSLPNSDKICRRQQIVEMYDNYTMSQAITVLQEYARLKCLDISNCVYYCTNGRINDRASWKRIREYDLSCPINQFSWESQRIDIIFDCLAY